MLLILQLPSSVPTKASSAAVFAVWLRVSGERVSVQVFHDVHHCELVLSGGARHHPALGAFRFPISGHKADAKRWWNAVNSCAGATQRPLASPEGISCIEAGNEPRSASGAASCGCWTTGVLRGVQGRLLAHPLVLSSCEFRHFLGFVPWTHISDGGGILLRKRCT